MSDIIGKNNDDTDRIDAVSKLVGHRFDNGALLLRALTHSSAANGKSYERLEFLGDRVLGLVLAEYFFTQCSNDDEGGLSLRLHAAARQSTLVEVATKLDVAPFVLAQSGMDVANNHSVLADVIESVIAALYLDGGLDVAKTFITAHWPLDTGAITNREKDAKSRLQELVLKRGLALPDYRLVDKTGPDHEPMMRYEVSVDGYEPVVAVGSSRKVAEQNAASEMLLMMSNK